MHPIPSKEEPLHFSELKYMAQSAKHYADNRRRGTTVTRAMRIGTAVHAILFDMPSKFSVFQGRRVGKEWEAFAARMQATGIPADEILNEAEYASAQSIADANYRHPVFEVARERAKFESPMTWDVNGMPCATRGIDVRWPTHNDDLKTCKTVQPDRLLRDCEQRLYHAQLAFYELGRERTEGFRRKLPHRLICIENVPPYDLVVVEVSDAQLEAGKRAIFAWLERLKGCIESNDWPGYTASPVKWEPRLPLAFDEDDEPDVDEDDEEITE